MLRTSWVLWRDQGDFYSFLVPENHHKQAEQFPSPSRKAQLSGRPFVPEASPPLRSQSPHLSLQLLLARWGVCRARPAPSSLTLKWYHPLEWKPRGEQERGRGGTADFTFSHAGFKVCAGSWGRQPGSRAFLGVGLGTEAGAETQSANQRTVAQALGVDKPGSHA